MNVEIVCVGIQDFGMSAPAVPALIMKSAIANNGAVPGSYEVRAASFYSH